MKLLISEGEINRPPSQIMEQNQNYGKLYNQNIKLHRAWFKQMTKLLGINCIYRAPLPGKTYNKYGDLDTNFYQPVLVGCIFDEYPNQKSLKKQGWVTELQEGSSLIHVPYDLEHLEAGGLFIIPSGIDGAEGRVFRILNLQNIIIYPASVTCEIAPEYLTSEEPTTTKDFTTSNFNVLVDNEGDD